MSIYQGNQLVAGCITASVPTGSIIPFAGSTAPTGFLLCDGSAVSRTTYSALYDVIGTTYGPGDGNTTFNLPNSSGRVLQGADSNHTAGTTIEAGLPNITGRTNDVYSGKGATTTGAFYSSGSNYLGLSTNTDNNNAALFFDASRSSSIYGNSSTVQPPAISTNFCIKY